MPLFYSHTIDENTRLAIWKIAEPEDFFLEKVPLSRSITHAHKRLQHLAGRYLLQHLFPDFPIHLIQIADTRKPFLPDESHHFSISHCGNFAAAIVSTERRVGIDIETPSERLLNLIPKFMNQDEQQLVTTTNMDQLIKLSTLFWSAKEAMYKWYSLGEISFQQHLHIRSIDFEQQHNGSLYAGFTKFQPVDLHLPFVVWDELVLTYTCL